jgi:hypothetical protein
MFVGFFTVIYYVTLMAWSFSLFFDSFKDPFPWVRTDAELAIANKALAESNKKLVADGKEAVTGIKASNIWNPDYFYK